MSSNHLPADERKSLTVKVVVSLAGTQNPSDITTAAIARQMNVTQGALFRHFPTKDAIWQAVMEWVADKLLDRLDRAAQEADSPLDALRAIFMTHIDFVVAHPGVPRMLFGELQRAEPTPAKKIAHGLLKRYAERLTRQLENAKAEGEVCDEIDPHAAAILFIGTIQGLVMQSMLSGNLQAARKNAPGVVAIFLRGVEAASSPHERTSKRARREK